MKEMLMTEKMTPDKNQISTWRPKDSIRIKVIGIAKQENRLLVCEILNDHGKLKGWCPLGGGLEFGETGEVALKREILEELGCNILINSDPIAFENIFEHHGFIGHEIILAFSIRLEDPKIYTKERFQIQEDKGSYHWVEWVDIERFLSGKDVLFPEALTLKLPSF